MIRSPNTEDEALGNGGSAYSLGSDGVPPHEISVMCGEQPVIPIIRAPQKPSTLHDSFQKPSIALRMTIGGL